MSLGKQKRKTRDTGERGVGKIAGKEQKTPCGPGFLGWPWPKRVRRSQRPRLSAWPRSPSQTMGPGAGIPLAAIMAFVSMESKSQAPEASWRRGDCARENRQAKQSLTQDFRRRKWTQECGFLSWELAHKWCEGHDGETDYGTENLLLSRSVFVFRAPCWRLLKQATWKRVASSATVDILGQMFILRGSPVHPWPLPFRCQQHPLPSVTIGKCFQTFLDVPGGYKTSPVWEPPASVS